MGQREAGPRHGEGRLRVSRAQESAREPRVDSGEMIILRIALKRLTFEVEKRLTKAISYVEAFCLHRNARAEGFSLNHKGAQIGLGRYSPKLFQFKVQC